MANITRAPFQNQLPRIAPIVPCATVLTTQPTRCPNTATRGPHLSTQASFPNSNPANALRQACQQGVQDVQRRKVPSPHVYDTDGCLEPAAALAAYARGTISCSTPLVNRNAPCTSPVAGSVVMSAPLKFQLGVSDPCTTHQRR